jgi:hypothetical protein
LWSCEWSETVHLVLSVASDKVGKGGDARPMSRGA